MNQNRKPAPEGLEKEFDYLDHLRESGATNMWGAAPFLEKAMGISPEEASRIFILWMNSFS